MSLGLATQGSHGTRRIGEDSVRARAEGDDRVGRLIDDRYRLLRRIGEGGMGLVYEARRVGIDRPLALKILRRDVCRRDSAARLEREAQSASAIGNEHIVEVRDFGRVDGATYVVMELVEGADLLSEIRRDKLPWPRARHIALQVCEALGAAHARGIVHRDLKPENVVLSAREGEPDFVKVLDFGIARMQGTARLTAAGTVVGTPEYMSPEQCQGIEVDARADVYAFGVLLFEMVTGVLPFWSEDLAELVAMQLYSEPDPPSLVRGDGAIGAAVDALILRCLAKDPADRFASMGEVARALRAIDEPLELLEPYSADEVPIDVELEVDGAPVDPRAWTRTARATWTFMALCAAGAAASLVALSPADAVAPAPIVPGPRVAAEPPRPPPPPRPEASPPAASVAPGPIVLASDPGGADVLSDGIVLGRTPLALPRPEAGARVALIVRRGRHDRRVVLGASSAERVHVDLTPRRARPRRATAAPLPEPPAEPEPTPEPPAAPPVHTRFLDPWAAEVAPSPAP